MDGKKIIELKKLGLNITISLLVIIFTIVAIESFAYWTLKLSGRPIQPFIFNSKIFELKPAQSWDKAGRLSYLDPILGFAHDPAIFADQDYLPGFVVYRSQLPGKLNPLRIVTLGGSTTTPSVRNSWPEQLHRILEKGEIASEVFNGGVAGYSSSQDLLKLMRDGLSLEPDIVICLQGVNDLGFIHAIPSHPLVSPYSKHVLSYISKPKSWPFLPNFTYLAQKLILRGQYTRGLSLGVPIKITPWGNWLRNVELMDAICQKFDIKFISVLHQFWVLVSFIQRNVSKRSYSRYGKKLSTKKT